MRQTRARKFRYKRAISPVISTVILTGVVIAMSFVVLSWAQYRSSAYQSEYGEAVDGDIAKLKERLAYEFIFYNSTGKALSVYIMNSGAINVAIQTVYVSNATWLVVFQNVNLKFLNGTSTQVLNSGDEGLFVLSLNGLVPGKTYSVRIISGRGSSFDGSFVA
ncbi:MAG: archaellin/type IV pilin N-terminal domain-containing protein [Candidatus Bathyarchaeia archaeon]